VTAYHIHWHTEDESRDRTIHLTLPILKSFVVRLGVDYFFHSEAAALVLRSHRCSFERPHSRQFSYLGGGGELGQRNGRSVLLANSFCSTQDDLNILLIHLVEKPFHVLKVLRMLFKKVNERRGI
jgi:hypothetical protein